MVQFWTFSGPFFGPKTLGLWGLGKMWPQNLQFLETAFSQLKNAILRIFGWQIFAKNCKVFGDFCRLGKNILTLGVWIHFLQNYEIAILKIAILRSF